MSSPASKAPLSVVPSRPALDAAYVAAHLDEYRQLHETLHTDILVIQAQLADRNVPDEDGKRRLPTHQYQEWRRKAVFALNIKTAEKRALGLLLKQARGKIAPTPIQPGSRQDPVLNGARFAASISRTIECLRRQMHALADIVPQSADLDDLVADLDEDLTDLQARVDGLGG